MKDVHNPKIYILNEYVGSQAPPEHHARAILEMIQETGLKPEQCSWTGDTAHQNHKADKRMSNVLLMRAYENILRYPPKTLPWKIRTVRKGKGSFYLTTSIIHAAMSRRSFQIQPNCQQLIQAIQRWQLKRTQSERSRDVYGHVVDYALFNHFNHFGISTPNSNTQNQNMVIYQQFVELSYQLSYQLSYRATKMKNYNTIPLKPMAPTNHDETRWHENALRKRLLTGEYYQDLEDGYIDTYQQTEKVWGVADNQNPFEQVTKQRQPYITNNPKSRTLKEIFKT